MTISSSWGITVVSKCFAEGIGLCNPAKSLGGFFKALNAPEETTSDIKVAPTELLPGASWQTRSL